MLSLRTQIIFLLTYSPCYVLSKQFKRQEEVVKYEPRWESLDKRPLPEWYDRAKIGILIHWGVYSVPSYQSEWFWAQWMKQDERIVDFMEKNYPPGYNYQDFANELTAEFFDANDWAALFAKAGAKYVIITAKHHEGFAMFPSKQSFNWNAQDIGPKRDVTKELATALRKINIYFGIYYSLSEWFNPIYLEDVRNKFATNKYVSTKLYPDLIQLIQDYSPSILWSDGDWLAPDWYWQSEHFLAWLYSVSIVKDTIVVNDRWGINSSCHHGDVFNCQSQFNPGKLIGHKWENVFRLDKKSWGYRREMHISDVVPIETIIRELVTTVSCGGNFLINIGPTKEGSIPPVFQERLLYLGYWASINAEGIYGSSPWYQQNDALTPSVWYTCKTSVYDEFYPTDVPSDPSLVTVVYAFVLEWPDTNQLELVDIGSYMVENRSQIRMLGFEDLLEWTFKNKMVAIDFPDQAEVKSEYAWTLKIINI